MKTSTTQRGFTLVELMIAVVIGLFLVGGLLTLVQAMKRTTVSQSGLSQLQENERMAKLYKQHVLQEQAGPDLVHIGGIQPAPAPKPTETREEVGSFGD